MRAAADRGTAALYDRAALMIRESSGVVAFCGAGVSAESGIATFRDAGGLWERFDPMEVGTAEGIAEAVVRAPGRILAFLREVHATLSRAVPNPGHVALARLEQAGKLDAVITQNVDDLQRQAGSRRVIELHGNLYRRRCVACLRTLPPSRKDFLDSVRPLMDPGLVPSLAAVLARAPRCECGGIFRPDVVLFGEMVQQLSDAFEAVERADMLLVLGTSGQVYPASALPGRAKAAGAKVLNVNPTEDAFSHLTDIYIPEKTGIALPEIVGRLAS